MVIDGAPGVQGQRLGIDEEHAENIGVIADWVDDNEDSEYNEGEDWERKAIELKKNPKRLETL